MKTKRIMDWAVICFGLYYAYQSLYRVVYFGILILLSGAFKLIDSFTIIVQIPLFLIGLTLIVKPQLVSEKVNGFNHREGVDFKALGQLLIKLLCLVLMMNSLLNFLILIGQISNIFMVRPLSGFMIPFIINIFFSLIKIAVAVFLYLKSAEINLKVLQPLIQKINFKRKGELIHWLNEVDLSVLEDSFVKIFALVFIAINGYGLLRQSLALPVLSGVSGVIGFSFPLYLNLLLRGLAIVLGGLIFKKSNLRQFILKINRQVY